MMLPSIKMVAEPYCVEEKNILDATLKNLSSNTHYKIAVVGAGSLSYIEIVLKYGLYYIAIDPLIHFYIQKEIFYIINKIPNVSIINSSFGSFPPKKLPSGQYVYAFIFNVFAYIDNGLEKINKYIKPGDIICISTWNLKSLASVEIRNSYFRNIYNSITEKEYIPEDFKVCKISDFDTFNFSKLRYYQNHHRVVGDIIDCLIIQC